MWFAEECAVHDALRAKFNTVPVPADLKDRILAGQKIIRPAVSAWSRRRTAFVAAAAAILIAVVVGAWFFSGGSDANLRAYRKDMAQFIADLYEMNARGTTWDDLRAAFAKQGWPSEFIVPDALRAVRIEGGCLTYWREQKVSLACMKTAENKGLWLFVIPRSSLGSAPAIPAPQIGRVGKLSTALWTQGDLTYLLATDGDEAALKKHL